MSLDSIIKSVLKKERCPESCHFRKRELAPAVVPPPEDIDGMIVSSDPTTRWLSTYLYAMHFDDLTRRRMLYASAIPKVLVGRIVEFFDWDLTNSEADRKRTKRLNDFLYEKTYWTHRHKCHTDSESDDFRFKKKTAKTCGNIWLQSEIDACEPKFILTLSGVHADWVGDMILPSDTEVIRIYHTSPRNNHLWYGRLKAKERMSKLEDLDKKKNYEWQRQTLRNELENLLKYIL